MLLIHFGNVNVKEVSHKDAYFKYNTMGIADIMFDYQYLLPILQKASPEKANDIGKVDLTFNSIEQARLKNYLEEELEDMLKDRTPEEDEGGLEKVILGRKIGLKMKNNPKDKRLSTLIALHSIIEDCLKEEKPMYIVVEEQE